MPYWKQKVTVCLVFPRFPFPFPRISEALTWVLEPETVWLLNGSEPAQRNCNWLNDRTVGFLYQFEKPWLEPNAKVKNTVAKGPQTLVCIWRRLFCSCGPGGVPGGPRNVLRSGPHANKYRNSATVQAVRAAWGANIGDFRTENRLGTLGRPAPIIWYHSQPSKPKSNHVR